MMKMRVGNRKRVFKSTDPGEDIALADEVLVSEGTGRAIGFVRHTFRKDRPIGMSLIDCGEEHQGKGPHSSSDLAFRREEEQDIKFQILVFESGKECGVNGEESCAIEARLSR